jgi:hypothetical protein
LRKGFEIVVLDHHENLLHASLFAVGLMDRTMNDDDSLTSSSSQSSRWVFQWIPWWVAFRKPQSILVHWSTRSGRSVSVQSGCLLRFPSEVWGRVAVLQSRDYFQMRV